MAMHYALFQPTDAQIGDLLDAMSVGRLVTATPSGPTVGIFPFVRLDGHIELHFNSKDPQLVALRADPRCAFQVDDILSPVPSHWIDPADAKFADILYRSVTIQGRAEIIADTKRIARHIEDLVAKHQPDGTHARLDANPPLYAQALGRLTMVRIPEAERTAKFRLSQQEPESTRRIIANRLRQRGSDRDVHTAVLIESTLA
jgi:predicted FMN-binding regulatory protein PaiB